MISPIVGSPHPGRDNNEAKRPHRRDDQAQSLGRHGVAVDDEKVGVDGDGSGKDGARHVALRPQPALRPAGLGAHMNGIVINPYEVGNERGGLDNIGDEKHVNEHQERVVALVPPADIGHGARCGLVGAVCV